MDMRHPLHISMVFARLYVVGCGDGKETTAIGTADSQPATEAGACVLQLQSYVTSCSADTDCDVALFGDFCEADDRQCLGTQGYINKQSTTQYLQDYLRTPMRRLTAEAGANVPPNSLRAATRASVEHVRGTAPS
jgi:hypothetical protein